MATRVEEIKNTMNKKSREARDQLRRDFQEFIDHPLLYSALIISGFLSSLAGLFLGLGFRIEGGFLLWKTDLAHIFFAFIYAALFPFFFEYGLANWLNKFLKREPNNQYQRNISGVMVFITFVGTAITAFSAMDVLVTSLGFFSSFKEIPPNVQGWIAFSLPAVLMFNIAAGEIYRQTSENAQLLRVIEKDLRDKQLDADNEVKIARMEARKQIELHAAKEYARQSTEAAPNIGRAKGSDQWDKDATQHMPAIQTAILATDVKREDFTDPPSRQS